MQVRLTPDVVRDMGPEEAERVLEVALAYAGRGVVGLNAAGSERTPRGHLRVRLPAREGGGTAERAARGRVGGRGERLGDPRAITIPTAIGHGVRSIDDPALVRELAERGIPLEVSPISNVATGVSPSLAAHPFLALRDAGVVVTLNSDDPPMFGAWLSEVYEAARQAWGLDDADLAEIARTGVRSSFADDHAKIELIEGIDAWLEAPTTGPSTP